MSQPKLNLIFITIKEKKQKIKNIKEMFKTSLENNKEYQSILDELSKIKSKKNLIESKLKEEMASEFDKINVLKQEIIGEESKLSDIVLKCLIEGEEVNITDKYDNEFEPVFKVKYKKV